jgi:hypothetical protein
VLHLGSPITVGPVSRTLLLRRLASRASRSAVAFGNAIDAHPVRAFAVLTAAYFATTFILSSLKLLWLDEFITLHIARLPNATAIWHALDRGADPNPPVIHLLVHLCRGLFGEKEWALRLPAMLGYWVGMLSLFAFLRRRIPAVWALSGTVMSMAMTAFAYSYESRSYAIFYGLAMLATLCWSVAVDPVRTPGRRTLALCGMVLALALGISTNYFAVLAFLPIAFGELARTIYCILVCRETFGRAFALRIWVALLLAATPLLAFRQLIAHSIAQFAPYAWNKVSLGEVADSYSGMVDNPLYAILGLILLAIAIRVLGRMCASCRASLQPRALGRLATQSRYARAAVPPYEAAAIFSLMIYPVLGYVVASIRGGMLSPRFVIPVCFGMAIAGTLAAYRVFGHLPMAGAALLVFCCLTFIARQASMAAAYKDQRDSFYRLLGHLPEAERSLDPNSPIVIPDPLLALTLQHYTDKDVAQRLVFPVDFPAIRVYRGDDSPEENLWAGRDSLYTIRVQPVSQLEASAGRYLIIASDGNWFLEDLFHHSFAVDRLTVDAQAGGIGGFTPLARGFPRFYTAAGEAELAVHPAGPIPFKPGTDLPSARPTSQVGSPF